MLDPIYQQVIVWVGLALLLVLCLPFAGIQKLVLEICAWGLRLALLALLGAAAYLWFRPSELPVEVTDALNNIPWLRTILPEPGVHHFGACAAGLVVIVLLPVLALLDVGRRLAGRRLRRLGALADAPIVEEKTIVQALPAPEPKPAPPPRRVDRRAAANTLARLGSRKPARAPEGVLTPGPALGDNDERRP
jgi:hypothetical protein